MAKRVVAVLRGGIGDEHDISLKSGAAVLKTFQLRDDTDTREIFIDRNGSWFVRGIEKTPERALQGVDVVWNALHGHYGEDGSVQRVLDRIGIPYTGSGAYASAIAMNKAATKRELEKAGIRTPRSMVVGVSPNLSSTILNCFRTFPQPSVVKPIDSGSSVGVTIARSFSELEEGVRQAFQHSSQVLIEEFICGREATCGIVEEMRGERQYALPAVEIVPPPSARFFDYDAKYGGASLERVPGNFTKEEHQTLQHAARVAHTTLGLRHYSRSDFIVSPRGVFFLETNTLPGLTEASLLPQALSAVGIPLGMFIEHVLDLAERCG